MYYYIKTGPKYWKPKGYGYTKNREEAGVFTLKDMEAFNLDGCTLERLTLQAVATLRPNGSQLIERSIPALPIDLG